MSAAPEDPDVGPETATKTQTLQNGWGVYRFLDADGKARWYIQTRKAKYENVVAGAGSAQYLQSDGSTAPSRYIFSSQSEMQTAIKEAQKSEQTEEKSKSSGGSESKVVDTVEALGRTFEVVARRDNLNRGPNNIQYSVNAVDGKTPEKIADVAMTDQADVRRAVRTWAEDKVESKTQGKENKQKVQTLENGWVVWTYVDDDGRQLWYIKTNDGQYVDDEGQTWDRQRAFASKSDLKRAIEKVREEFVYGRENSEKRIQTVERENRPDWQVWSYLTEDGNRRWYVRVPAPTDAVPMSTTPPSDIDSLPNGSGSSTSTDRAEYLQPDGTTASSFYEFDTKAKLEEALGESTDSAVGGLGYGWQIVETPQEKYHVLRREEDGTVYLEADGSTTSVETAFASKKKARRAFRRWREENVGQKRAEANEAAMEQSEEFLEALEQQQSSTQVETTTNTVEGDTVTATSDETGGGETSGNGGGGSGPTVEISTSGSESADTGATTTAMSRTDDGSTIPLAAIAAAFVALLILVLR